MQLAVSSEGVEFERRSVIVDGLATGYLEAGDGDPVVLLHGGEFGASADLGWERTIDALAVNHRVLAPDMLGYGLSAKVVDFVDGRALRIRHVRRFCDVMGVDSAHFVGNSMGAINLLTDTTSESPVLPVRSLALICGGGAIQRNEHADALYEYDGSLEGMRRVVTALFFDPAYPADDDYLRRRHESSIMPGAWEAIASARFRRPGLVPPASPSITRAYERITVPTLLIEGAGDKLLPPGWAADIAGRIAGAQSAVVDGAGHCPQIERPEVVNDLLRDVFRWGYCEMTNELAGKVAIVTGGASGIGRGIVERFLDEGARVVIADVQTELGTDLAANAGEDAIFRQTDVGDQEQVGHVVAAAIETFGGLHVMVNNAGRSSPLRKGLFDEDFAEFDNVMRVNLLGVMAGTRDAARHMAEHGGGSIVNMASIGGVLAGGGVPAYRASKAAVIHFTKSAAIELAAYEVRVNCIAPGNIPTPLLQSAATDEDRAGLEKFEARIRQQMRDDRPLKREGTAGDVAEAVLYFATDRSRYVTGTVLPVDGGTVAGKVMPPRKPQR